MKLPRSGLGGLLKRQVLTLGLDGSSLNILAVQGGRATGWVSMPFNPQIARGGSVQDPTSLATVIKNAVTRVGGRGAQVLAAFPSGRVTTRLLALPSVGAVSPDRIIPREMGRLLGSAATYNHLFWAPVKREGAQSVYYVVAAPRTDLDNFTQALTLSGLRPTRIEPVSLALARAVGAAEALIISLSLDRVEVVVVSDFLPLVSTQRELELGTGLTTLLAELADEVTRSVGLFNTLRPGRPLPGETPAYLAGGHPQIDAGLAAALSRSLGRPVELPRAPLPHPPDLPVPQFLANLGLAARG